MNLETTLPPSERAEEILSPSALDFVGELHGRFDDRRLELLSARETRGAPQRFLEETRDVRQSDWEVAPVRADYADRRVEITGPTDRKLVINALNSGARGFMADFEDANSPTWRNQIEGQVNLLDAVEGSITYDASDGRHYELSSDPATLLVRPRGWHLPEKHAHVNGTPVAGALLDFGLYAFHCAPRLAAQSRGVYLYLPKLEHHLEARLWNDVLSFSEEALGLPTGTMRATVLIETLPAAFQMDEILWELRDHAYGMNAGRWDYIFSMIKCFREDRRSVLPDRQAVTMTVPFMRAYTELLVRTCHRRGAFAIGGMSALIPSRTDPEVNKRALAAVKADKRREAGDGFDGTWVAHPDVVAVARAEFDAVLAERPNQIERKRPDVKVTSDDLLNVAATPGEMTEAGLRNNINVGFRYLSFWLSGRGAAGIDGLMEDAATAEIARSQILQWIHHGHVSHARVVELLDQEMATIRAEVGDGVWAKGRPDDVRRVFEEIALGQELPPFLTLAAYQLLD